MIVRFKKIERGQSFMWQGLIYMLPEKQLSRFIHHIQIQPESWVFPVNYSDEPLEVGCLVHHHRYLLCLLSKHDKKGMLSNGLTVELCRLKRVQIGTLEDLLHDSD